MPKITTTQPNERTNDRTMSEYDDDNDNERGFYAEDHMIIDEDEQQRELIDSYYDVCEEEDASSLQSRRRSNKKREELMQMDKGFAILNPKSKTPIAYFHTDTNPGSTIRNAVTGIYESGHKFGSPDEDLFFKVVQSCCCAHFSEHHIMFYDTPEQYEKHFRVTVSSDTKQKWSEKSMRRRQECRRGQGGSPRSNLPTIVK